MVTGIDLIPIVLCPVCGSSDRMVVERLVPDFKYRVPGRWCFVRCNSCRLVYLSEALARPADGYPPKYSQHRSVELPEMAGSFVRRELRRAFLALRGYRTDTFVPFPKVVGWTLGRLPSLRIRAGYGFILLPPSVPEGRLLDVGCGNGRFLAIMKMLGWEVHGVEPDPQSAELAYRASGADIQPTLKEACYPGNFFDAITMNHALEHVGDPLVTLRECHRICRPEGQIGIVVPNWKSLGHRLFRYHWYALEPPRHLVMYEPSTLTQVVERSGFVVKSAITVSVREGRGAWTKSWLYKTGRTSPRALTALWQVLSAVAGVVSVFESGEELVLWARKP